MNANPQVSQPHTASAAKQVNQGQREPAHREVPAGSPSGPQTSVVSRRARHIAAAERNLAEAYKAARAAGIDRDILYHVFSPAVDCLNDARHGRDLAGTLAEMQYERYQARHRRMASDPVTPDAPGLDLCPDLDAVSTAAEFWMRSRCSGSGLASRATGRWNVAAVAASPHRRMCTALNGQQTARPGPG